MINMALYEQAQREAAEQHLELARTPSYELAVRLARVSQMHIERERIARTLAKKGSG